MTRSWILRAVPALPLALLLLVAESSHGQTAPTKGTTSPAAQSASVGGPAQKPGGPAQRRYVTVTGEILDMGCFTAHGLRGAVHRSCANQCLRSGVPMGLISADSTVYMLTENHDRAMAPSNFPPPDPYGQCRSWASFQVEVSGFMWERMGSKFLEVMSANVAPPAPAKP